MVEGCGAHGCEYMTGGTVVILGETGWNFGAGMSGGEAFVLDSDGRAQTRLNADSVVCGPIIGEANERLKALVVRHAAETGSPLALRLIETWPDAARRFRHVLPRTEAHAAASASAGGKTAARHYRRPDPRPAARGCPWAARHGPSGPVAQETGETTWQGVCSAGPAGLYRPAQDGQGG